MNEIFFFSAESLQVTGSGEAHHRLLWWISANEIKLQVKRQHGDKSLPLIDDKIVCLRRPSLSFSFPNDVPSECFQVTLDVKADDPEERSMRAVWAKTCCSTCMSVWHNVSAPRGESSVHVMKEKCVSALCHSGASPSSYSLFSVFSLVTFDLCRHFLWKCWSLFVISFRVTNEMFWEKEEGRLLIMNILWELCFNMAPAHRSYSPCAYAKTLSVSALILALKLCQCYTY